MVWGDLGRFRLFDVRVLFARSESPFLSDEQAPVRLLLTDCKAVRSVTAMTIFAQLQITKSQLTSMRCESSLTPACGTYFRPLPHYGTACTLRRFK